jgi:hypothetical protein
MKKELKMWNKKTNKYTKNICYINYIETVKENFNE